jgi:hypothetical protein
MRFDRFLLLVITLLPLFSCKQKAANSLEIEKVQNQFIQAMKEVDPSRKIKNKEAFLLIPNTGCSGCINEAEMMLKREIEKESNLKYILTNIESVKLLKNKLGIDVSTHKKIIVDKDNYFYQNDLRSIYPKMYLFNSEGHLFKVLEISPLMDGVEIYNKMIKEGEFKSDKVS